MSAVAMRGLPEVLRDGMVEADRVLAVLREGPLTIPDLAGRLGRPTSEVTLWVMALRRYGRIEALAKPATEEYYRYSARQGAP